VPLVTSSSEAVGSLRLPHAVVLDDARRDHCATWESVQRPASTDSGHHPVNELFELGLELSDSRVVEENRRCLSMIIATEKTGKQGEGTITRLRIYRRVVAVHEIHGFLL